MLEDQLERQESYRRFVYDDATGQEIVPGYTVQGNPTIGYGRDLMTEGSDYAGVTDCPFIMVRIFRCECGYRSFYPCGMAIFTWS